MGYPIILEKDLSLLQSLIGQRISFAVAPDLFISRNPYSEIPHIHSKNPLIFYHSSPINLCVTRSTKEESTWVAMDSWPKTAEWPDALLSVWSTKFPITKCLYGKIKYPDGWIIEAKEFDERPARLELWTDSIICRIVVHKIGEGAALTCEHDDGIIWSAYAEYGRKIWLSFDKEVVSTIETERDDYIVL